MSENVTRLLDDLRAGRDEAMPSLLAAVDDELRRLAAAQLARERPDHTLQPTALVNEAYLRLGDQRQQECVSGRRTVGDVSTVRFARGNCFLAMGRLDEAVTELEAALGTFETLGHADMAAQARFLLDQARAADGS